MIHLFLNGLAASAGGGLTYLRNVLPQLSARKDAHTTVALSPQLRNELEGLPNVSCLEAPVLGGPARRFWHEQAVLARLVRDTGAEVLIAAGNVALRKSPVPQILLSRNSLYTSRDFARDLRTRQDYRLWLDTRIKGVIAKSSIQLADCTVAPTQAFAEELQHWAGRDVTHIYHGFDRGLFFSDKNPLPPELERELAADPGSLRLLFVSHYNYYRNFETLFRAVPLMREGLGARKIKLFLTCTLRSEDNPGSYHPEKAAALIQQLGIAENVVELGTVAYSQLHHLYRACDIYVTAAYAESFAHPLLEAMASGLPVVASDLPVHREICDAAAVYFSRFSAAELAGKIIQVASSVELAREMVELGQRRSCDFSWTRHVDELIRLSHRLLERSDGAGHREMT
jgi:glycosyltransferase involved in cell wall biosynthesis